MTRREFLGIVGAAAVAWPLSGRAQQAGKIFRLAQLSGGTAVSRVPLVAALKGGMRDLGYVEGKNLVFEERHAEGKFENLPTLARELIAWNPDVLVVSTTPAALAVKQATFSLPVVFVSVADPIGVGLISTLAQPGGNITGVTNIGAELAGKRLEILKEMVPTASKVAVFINPADQNATLQMDSAKPAADKLAVRLDPVLHIRSGTDLKGAFETATRARADGALRMLDPIGIDLRHQTVQLAAEYKLPLIYPFRGDVAAGGLVSYGADLPGQYRQAATFVHKIFNGVKPADLPVEQPTKFDLAVNLKAARALGLSVPPTLLARADEVIE